jgi:hypothetical protein
LIHDITRQLLLRLSPPCRRSPPLAFAFAADFRHYFIFVFRFRQLISLMPLLIISCHIDPPPPLLLMLMPLSTLIAIIFFRRHFDYAADFRRFAIRHATTCSPCFHYADIAAAAAIRCRQRSAIC